MRVTACLIVGVAVLGCSDGAPVAPRTGGVEEAFSIVERVELDTAIVATIGDLRSIEVFDSMIVVSDGMADRLVAFDRSGRFMRGVGRRGEAPGEFVTPMLIEQLQGGELAILDISPRVTVLGPDLELLRVEELPVPTMLADLITFRDRIFVHQWASRVSGDNYVEWRPSEGLGDSFDERSSLVLEVPYWNAVWTTLATASSEHVFVADNMVYPIRRYGPGLTEPDSVGTAPRSWIQASRPERGDFAVGSAVGDPGEWKRSFTRIDDLVVVQDEWLIVAHRQPRSEYRSEDEIRADVYQLEPFTKVWEDVELPGPVLEGGACAWIIEAYPPQPWTLSCLQPEAPRGSP